MKSDIHTVCPEYNRENLVGTFIDLSKNQMTTMLEGIVDTHQSLYGLYSSNSNFKFQNRTVITNVFDKGRGFKTFSDGNLKFLNFMKYLCYFDSADFSDKPRSEQPHCLLESAFKRGDTTYTFDQCEVRMFANGNIHIWLNDRPDLLERLNEALENYYGRALPPCD
jgi:hypothetical protein